MKNQLLFISLFFSAISYGQTVTDTIFYTGDYDSLIILCSDSVELTAYGAQGVDGVLTGGTGGLGAVASGKLNVSYGDVLYFFAGGQVGFNGGGAPGSPGVDAGGTNIYPSGMGGDASDVRLNGTTLADRVLVAAGGGGGSAGPQGSCSGGPGGNGGDGGDNVIGLNGTSGSGCGTGGTGGTGGTPTDGGTGGAGSTNCTVTAPDGVSGTIGAGGVGGDGFLSCGSGYTGSGGGGGGGGFYGGAGGGAGAGGGGGAWAGGGGAGGASFIGLVNDSVATAGVNTGLGYIVVTYLPISTSSVSETSCGNYTSPSGNYTWSTTGMYSDTLTSMNGCDSIIAVDLTVIAPTSSSLNLNTCEAYVSPSGNHTWNTSGVYTDTIMNAAGCDSIITIDLTVTILDLTVSTNFLTITSNATGVTYQWLDCDNAFAPINGETSASFTATANGSYAVEVSNNGCVDTSACTVIDDVSIIENGDLITQVTLYPNPTSGKVNLKFDEVVNKMNVTVFDAVGRVVYQYQILSSDHLQIDAELFPGVYRVQLVDPEGKMKQMQFIRK